MRRPPGETCVLPTWAWNRVLYAEYLARTPCELLRFRREERRLRRRGGGA